MVLQEDEQGDTHADPEPEIELRNEGPDEVSWDAQTRDHLRQIVTQKVDLPISRLRQMIDDGEIDLAPDFQRRMRWTRAQKSRLVESVIMNVPIPPVFLGEDRPGQYVVLDGRQRLTAIYEYLGGLFALSGLKVWANLNGRFFASLPSVRGTPIASEITRRFVPAVVILHESVPEVKYEVFDRLNTGGVIAEPMEVRNAIYRGDFTRLLHEVTGTPEFLSLWKIPSDATQRQRNGAYRRMADLEMALRFFAFQHYEDFKGSVKSFLNRYMEQRNKEYRADITQRDADKALFQNTLRRTLDLLGEDAFHRTVGANQRSQQPSAPLSDAVLYAVSSLPDDLDAQVHGPQLRTLLDKLCMEDVEFQKAITVGTNAVMAAACRIERATEAFLSQAASG